jgi:hypothetical protein
MFTACFDGIAKLMDHQIEAARLKGVQVDVLESVFKRPKTRLVYRSDANCVESRK